MGCAPPIHLSGDDDDDDDNDDDDNDDDNDDDDETTTEEPTGWSSDFGIGDILGPRPLRPMIPFLHWRDAVLTTDCDFFDATCDVLNL